MHNADDDKKDVGDNFCLSTPQTLIPDNAFFHSVEMKRFTLLNLGPGSKPLI